MCIRDRSKPIHKGGMQRFRTRHTPSVHHYTLHDQKRKEFFVQTEIVSQNSDIFCAKVKNVRDGSEGSHYFAFIIRVKKVPGSTRQPGTRGFSLFQTHQRTHLLKVLRVAEGGFKDDAAFA